MKKREKEKITFTILSSTIYHYKSIHMFPIRYLLAVSSCNSKFLLMK